MLKTNSKIHIKSGAGFTLIEMIVVMGIFTTVVLIALGLYFNITQTQKRIVSLQKIQEDIRFTVEAMAQSIRLSSINYSFYNNNAFDLHPTADVNDRPKVLALIGQAGDYVFYRKSTETLQYCTGTLAECDLTGGTKWQDITPAEVKIVNLEFLITPSADPFDSTVAVKSCTADLDCTSVNQYKSYRCKPNTCKYFSDGKNFQPKVRLMLSTQGTSEVLKERASISVQTTVTSRIANSAILNNNND